MNFIIKLSILGYNSRTRGTDETTQQGKQHGRINARIRTEKTKLVALYNVESTCIVRAERPRGLNAKVSRIGLKICAHTNFGSLIPNIWLVFAYVP